MLNVPDTSWSTLYECDDPERARMLATCVAAMEYEVRIDDPDGEGPRFVVQVSEDDFPHLVEIVDEILDEQEQFDEFLDRWRVTASRRERKLLVAIIIIVSSLAVVGAVSEL